MIRNFYSEFVGGRGAIGLLALRLVMGAAFVLHGMSKAQNPLHWMDKMPGGAAPAPLQALAALAEFGGGIALILGLLTPLAAFGILCTMAVAFFKAKLPSHASFVAAKPGAAAFEDVAVYFAAALMLLLVGPGTLSLDHLLFGGRGGRMMRKAKI